MAARTKKAATTEVVEIRALEIKRTRVKIVGDTPLIVHAWSEKAKRMMLEAQQGKKAGKAKPVRNPVDDFIQACYWLTPKPVYPEDADENVAAAAFDDAIEKGARFGFPATAVKQATQSAAYRLGWVKNQMSIRGALYIESDPAGLVEIHSDTPVIREDMVKLQGMTADLRYRPQFNNWWMELDVSYSEAFGISWENLLNSINAAGFACGLGEWRPERDGQFGRFHVE